MSNDQHGRVIGTSVHEATEKVKSPRRVDDDSRVMDRYGRPVQMLVQYRGRNRAERRRRAKARRTLVAPAVNRPYEKAHGTPEPQDTYWIEEA